MGDQAEKLRRIMGKDDKKKGKVISVTSGKGGVGKTSFIINFAISLSQLGYKVVIVDADIGLSNVEILTGIISKSTIVDLIQSEKDIFDIMTEGPGGIKIISGGSGFRDFSLVDDKNLNKLINEIEKLERCTDFVLIDTGAGISNNVLQFLMASDEVIIMVTSEPTSLTDGYVLIKTLALNDYKKTIKVVINMVESKREAEKVFEKLNTVTKRFLQVNLEYLGYLNQSKEVSNAIKAQIPFVLDKPNSSIAKKINIIALSISNGESEPIHNDDGFSQRIKKFFFGKGGLFI